MRLTLLIVVLLSRVACAQQEVTFTWDAATSGPAPEGYRLGFGPSTGTTTTAFNVGLVTTATVLVPAGAWYVRAYAFIGTLLSPSSNELQVVVPTTVDPCVASPLVVTVTQWPQAKKTLTYEASQTITSVSYVLRRKTIIGAEFTDVRGCTTTVLR